MKLINYIKTKITEHVEAGGYILVSGYAMTGHLPKTTQEIDCKCPLSCMTGETSPKMVVFEAKELGVEPIFFTNSFDNYFISPRESEGLGKEVAEWVAKTYPGKLVRRASLEVVIPVVV